MKLPLKEIAAHARATYPQECCGLVMEDADKLVFVPIDNIAGAGTASERSKADGYEMDAQQLLKALESGRRLVAIVHSHPEVGAYFSNEDKHMALGGGDEPLWPGVQYLVVSVRDSRVDGARLYTWNDLLRDFDELEIPEITAYT